MEEKAVYRVIPRTPKSEVRIQRSEYKERDYINVRLYRNMVNKETGEREWFPTKKGIAIPLEQLGEYIATLQAVATELDPPDNPEHEDPKAEARAQAEADARPVDKLCMGCKRECKQIGVLVECPQYDPVKPPVRKGGRKKCVS